MRIPVFFFTLLLYVGSVFAESATTSRSTELQEKASADSAVLATLANQTKVDVMQRNGGWTQVKTGNGQSGWVRMTSLRYESAGPSTAVPTSGGSLLGSLATSGRTSNSGSVGSGVKGLDKEDLKRASPNYAELQKMQRFAVDKNSAQSFAQKSSLNPTNVAYLDQNNSGKRENN